MKFTYKTFLLNLLKKYKRIININKADFILTMPKKSFSEKCYALLKKVPKGKITTYKELAHALGTKAYRAVGNAMNKNPYGYPVISSEAIRNRRSVLRGDSKRTSGFFLVPCHRVIKSNGEIGEFAERLCDERKKSGRAGSRVPGTKKKIEMLKKEGIPIKKNRIENMENFLYKF